MKKIYFTLVLIATAMFSTTAANAQDLTLSGGADFVSTYVWRGAYGAGASIQPYAELALGNFAVGAWGSTALDATSNAKEVDWYVSYSAGNFSAMITDYWWEGEFDDAGSAYKYFGKNSNHYYEAALSYTFGDSFPLSLSVSTMFAGDKDTETDEEQYSTYIALAYPLTISDVDFEIGVGVTPSAGMYADKFSVCSLSLRAAKSITITDKFELPVFVDGIANPAARTSFLLFGTSLSF